LEYTTIYNEWVGTIEAALETSLQALIPNFSMQEFIEMVASRPDQITVNKIKLNQMLEKLYVYTIYKYIYIILVPVVLCFLLIFDYIFRRKSLSYWWALVISTHSRTIWLLITFRLVGTWWTFHAMLLASTYKVQPSFN